MNDPLDRSPLLLGGAILPSAMGTNSGHISRVENEDRPRSCFQRTLQGDAGASPGKEGKIDRSLLRGASSDSKVVKNPRENGAPKRGSDPPENIRSPGVILTTSSCLRQQGADIR